MVHRAWFLFRWLCAFMLITTATALWIPSHQLAHAQAYLIGQAGFPSTIRVAIRENNMSGEPDPRGRIIYVTTVNFDQYCRDVIPNEWFPSWLPASLESGAIAVKMFAWYHHLHPVTVGGFTFDVDNTVNFQTYKAFSDQDATDRAYYRTRSLAFVQPSGEIFELNYRAGYENSPNWQYRNSQKMSQWGTQFLASQGRDFLQILQFYYVGRSLVSIPGVGKG
ncbi:SpoIID/LytB domain-containing protein [Ferroacidibacillus organovorans]|nr:SpoIID/LytB domain-containing protein [Ferroacidibacillus organovorans]